MRMLLAAIVTALALLAGTPSWAGPKASDLVQAELIAEPARVTPGKPFWVGIRLRMKEHWHTYWRNAGDSGLPTEVKWSLPEGVTPGELEWPTPERIAIGPLVNYGYETEVVLLTRMTPWQDLAPGRPLELKASVSYLVCERECIPGEASLSTTVPVGSEGGGAEPVGRALFDAARARLPASTDWSATVRADGDSLLSTVTGAALAPEALKGAYFFPFDETAVDFEAAQEISAVGRDVTLRLKRGSSSTDVPASLGGVLTVGEGASARAYQIGAPPPASASAAAEPVSASPAPARAQPILPVTLADVLGAALFAFLGGLVLNLMPCVFPVLSIKVLSLVRHAGHTPGAVRLNGIAYAAGVVGSFVALAALLLAIRAAGAEIGWGFQLQSPAFVAGLAFLLLAMALSLSGVVELGTSLASAGGGLAQRDGLSGSFFTGVLATVVATPCTAPFMGSAVGYALTAPTAVALVIFVALGLGLALPFVVLAFLPPLVRLLPRPGRWMETLKQLLAFPIYATVAWLIFVLSQEVGPSGLFAALIGLVVVGFAAWAWRFVAFGSGWPRRVAGAGVLASLVALVALGMGVEADRASASVPVASAGAAVEPFTQARLDALQAEGRPVFVDLTAAWCITCLVNERVALSSGTVQEAFKSRRVVYMKGDWTNQNPEITRLLERHGRSGVPLYLLYPGRGEAVVLPQILTESIVLDSLGQVAGTKRADAGP